MNKRLQRAQDLNNDSDALTNTWTINGHSNLFLSDYDPIHSKDLKGLDYFCLYTHGLEIAKDCLVPLCLITDVVEFDKVLKRFDKLTNYETNKGIQSARALASN